ncbi:MAG TPA: phosphopantothenoylcysteine decarboxylase [Kiritimatiellia bacterium]|nr:phosphopantothenoylcysteine decarboxylase [Kiritimatiellia bacterium]HPS09000.1 phosphopantothenoylcysteine decarboxylase [Kiritimatiellia bacterium]
MLNCQCKPCNIKPMKILITAGPTREHLDPVRFLSNRSTGKMGFAVAQAAAERGHAVTLVAGPVSLATPQGVVRVDVVSARDMLAAIRRLLPDQDALVMSAAVADWRPRQVSETKLKKAAMAPVIELEPNPDILKTVRPLKAHRLFVGFAAETGDPLAEAQRKLEAKGLDLIVANDVTRPDAGFAVDTNRVTFIAVAEDPRSLPLQSKLDVGREIVAWVERHLPPPAPPG